MGGGGGGGEGMILNQVSYRQGRLYQGVGYQPLSLSHICFYQTGNSLSHTVHKTKNCMCFLNLFLQFSLVKPNSLFFFCW